MAKRMPAGPLGETIRLGQELVHATSAHPLMKPYGGNALNCTSCHLEEGQQPQAGTFRGIATAYPAYSPREKRVITLEDRVWNCCMRSLNGLRPPLDSHVSVVMTTYITWLSQGQPLARNPAQPLGPYRVPDLQMDETKADKTRGQALYAEYRAVCHGVSGQGDEENPPLWGPNSYNQGAGLASVPKLTNWLKVAMPLGYPSLTAPQTLI